MFHPAAAIIISGGYDSSNEDNIPTTVEILHADGTPWCSLPDIPGTRVRHSHTQSGLIACGGSFTTNSNNCYTFSSGSWTKSHILLSKRNNWVDILSQECHHTLFIQVANRCRYN